MLGLKLNHVSKRGPRRHRVNPFINITMQHEVCNSFSIRWIMLVSALKSSYGRSLSYLVSSPWGKVFKLLCDSQFSLAFDIGFCFLSQITILFISKIAWELILWVSFFPYDWAIVQGVQLLWNNTNIVVMSGRLFYVGYSLYHCFVIFCYSWSYFVFGSILNQVWPCIEEAASSYLIQCWPSSLMHVCIVWHHWLMNLLQLTFIIIIIVNILRPRQNGHHFPHEKFKCIFLKKNVWISLRISLKYVSKVRVNNIPSLVQIMAWHWPGDKLLSEQMMVNALTKICVTRPPHKPPHISPSWANYGALVWNTLKNDHKIF